MMKEYLKLELKKPALSSEEEKHESIKNALNQNLKRCQGRMDSIELLSENDKLRDAHVLLKHLLSDITVTVLEFLGKPVQDYHATAESIRDLGDEEFSALFRQFNKFSESHNLKDIADKELEEAAREARKLLNILEKKLLQRAKQNLSTPLDRFKTKIKFQIMTAGILVVMVIGGGIYYNIKYFHIKKDFVQVFFTAAMTENETEEKSIKQDVVTGTEWFTYTFTFPDKTNIEKLRIDPVNQKRIRLSFDTVKFYDKSGKILFERNFAVNQNIVIDNYEQVVAPRGIKFGINSPGKPVEFITSSEDPGFTLLPGKLTNVHKVELKIRMSEDYNKLN